ncbi:unnamed protein product [Protopolystoma xenopodis]|uniref:Uncharacterized protein n=1 Tax=Protopolystoma xenopodis TaxID=117903 RepID=A0A3S5BJD7_9PLAT|nr:unnamed protein product [Protopolystoma xenopodis]
MAPASSTASICRRLFSESVPRAIVQKTLENVITKDQERFSTRWNFDLFRSGLTEDINKLQTPVSSSVARLHPKLEESKRLEPIKWKLVQPDAIFYSTPPRKLKARRRVSPSFAECVNQESPIGSQNEWESKENTSDTCGVPQNQTSVPPPGPVQNQPAETPDRKIRRSILIRPHSRDEGNVFQILPFSQFSIAKASALGSLQRVKRSRLSEQPVKRCLDSRVTDYFAVSKRARESLK